MIDLDCTREELNFLANHMTSDEMFPFDWQKEISYRNIAYVDQEQAGGASMRLKVIAARQFAHKNPGQKLYPLLLTVVELWLIEQKLSAFDFRKDVMDDNTPVIRFAERVWDRLILEHADKVDGRMLGKYTASGEERTDEQTAYLAEVDTLIEQTNKETQVV